MRRALFLRLHRYAGLSAAGLLFLVGLTGSIIAFEGELDALLNPHLFQTTTKGVPLSPAEIVARVETQDARLHVLALPLVVAPGESVVLAIGPRINPATSLPYPVTHDQAFVDPVTGKILGTRQYGACCLEREQLIPFLYRLHSTLHLPGKWGPWVMGLVAILWLVDTFVGVYLGTPHGQSRRINWRRVLTIRTGGTSRRIAFDLHRAAGLWFATLFIAIAISGVYLNLPNELFRPALAAVVDLSPTPEERALHRYNPTPEPPKLDFDAAAELAHEQAAELGWTTPPYRAFHVPVFGSYGVGFDPAIKQGLDSAWIFVDDSTGEILESHIPGTGTAGDIFLDLLFPLHSGQIAGLPTRILVSAAGLVLAILSATGIAIWWRRRPFR